MRTASISDPPSCAASMFSSPCSRSSQGASFGRNLYAWLRRVLTLPTEPGDAVRRPSGERLSYCDADTRNAVDSVDVVVRDDKPKKQRTSGELLAAAAAAASTATSTGTSQVTVTTQQTRSPSDPKDISFFFMRGDNNMPTPAARSSGNLISPCLGPFCINMGYEDVKIVLFFWYSVYLRHSSVIASTS